MEDRSSILLDTKYINVSLGAPGDYLRFSDVPLREKLTLSRYKITLFWRHRPVLTIN